jgi:hypothetical protein
VDSVEFTAPGIASSALNVSQRMQGIASVASRAIQLMAGEYFFTVKTCCVGYKTAASGDHLPSGSRSDGFAGVRTVKQLS